LRSRFGECFSRKENVTDHNKNFGNPSYRYYRQWFMDYKGPEPEGLCKKLKKKRTPISPISQIVKKNKNKLSPTKINSQAGKYIYNIQKLFLHQII